MARGKNNRGGRGGGGRGRGRGRGGRGKGGGGGGGARFEDNRQSFDQVNKHNEKLERFYNNLNIVPEGEEREKFWTALRRELPNSFRFTGSKGHAQTVKENLIGRYFDQLRLIKHEDKPVDLPYVMKWYPEELAYAMTTPKHVIRKYEAFKEFQKFLVSETSVGNISRQEQVSMIPPLVMDIKPEHTVLDLCAAPGSKSAQLIEAIHAGEEERVAKAIDNAKGGKITNGASANGSLDTTDQGRATGLLIANDVNYQRAQMLVHQVKRLNSPNLIVMNHDATQFPSIQLPSEDGKNKYLKFDRILADVPCSGDGTCRKNPGIWRDWSPQNGLGLYATQVRILTRSLQMLKAGGRVVYSTCSMNPVEDEAVVSSAIERCGGVSKVKLIDCSERLPGLIRSPGLTDWSIMSRTGQMYESWPEAESNEPEGSRIVPGMFAPEEAENIPLQHCMRVYPHQQDTGGFFIAVLEKLSEIRAKPENESKSASKKWTFSEPPKEDTTNSAFGEIMSDVRSAEVDSQGHLIKTDSDVIAGSGDVSAAARQNESVGAAPKRSADEAFEDTAAGMVKKSRLGDDPLDSTSTADTSRRERGALPPSVAMAVEAHGGQPGSQMVEDAGTSTNGSGVVVDEPTADAARNAPFDKETIPPPAVQAIQNRRNRRDGASNEEAFKYLPADHPELESIYKFYELHPDFPRDRFLVRNPAGDPVKGIYYSTQLAKDILTTNAEGKGLKFVHAGVKMFMKQDAQGQDICRWRIQTEGLPLIEGWVGEGRVITLTQLSTLKKLLVEMFPHVGKADEAEAGWRRLGEIGEQVLGMGMGCCMLRVELEGAARMTLPLWRSINSVNLMLPKEDRKAMLLRIFNEDIELINHSDPAYRQKLEASGAHGSMKAEGDAEEVQRKIEVADDKPLNDEELEKMGVKQDEEDVKAAWLDGEAQALEADAEAKRDEMEAAKLEEMEDEDKKMTDAMPERQGEGDEANTTV